jgi:tetratricopeptide (TPR) repeat protein
MTAVVLSVLVLWIVSADRAIPTGGITQGDLEQRNAVNEQLLNYVRQSLEHLEDHLLDQMQQFVERLNQWIVTQRASKNWRVDPLVVRSVPEDIQLKLRFDLMRELKFQMHEGPVLQEAAWLRDISRAVESSSPGDDDLVLAQRLFDWTTRNIQLEPEPRTPIDLSWHTLILGRGTALNRAWTFILLARQQGLEVCMLGYPAPDGSGTILPWVPALLHQGELYLFEHEVGVPVPGPGGAGVATLSQAMADPRILAQLDVDERRLYRIAYNDLKDREIVALIEASPQYLSQRMEILENQLSGRQRLVLTVRPSRLEEAYLACKHIARVEIWQYPYQVLLNNQKMSEQERLQSVARMNMFRLQGIVAESQRNKTLMPEHIQEFMQSLGQNTNEPTPEQVYKELPGALWKGRMLQFRGEFAGEQGAVHYFQAMRPTDAELAALEGKMNEQLEKLRQQIDEVQRPGPAPLAPDKVDKLKQIAADLQQRLAELPQSIAMLTEARRHATYWLGLIAYERGDYQTSADYLSKQILEKDPGSPFVDGARYNLGRALEALGRYDEAIQLFESDTSVQQRYGSLWRMQRLREKLAQQAPPP